MIRKREMLAWFVGIAMFWNGASADTILFRDDFNGPTLDTSVWNVGNFTFNGNRTYFGLTPALAGGVARLQFDTFNPDHVGTHFLGTDIYSKQNFAQTSVGLEFEARVRTNVMPNGLVTALYSYGFNPNTTSDEIDFEIATNEINASPVPPGTGQPVYLTTYNDWDGNAANWQDGIHHSATHPTVPGLNLNEFNTFTIRWLPDRTEWLINGTVVRTTTQAHADDPMRIDLNFWAPENSFTAAFSAALQPATAAANNQSFFYDVDYALVRLAPEPKTASLAIGGGLLAGLLVRRIRRAPRLRKTSSGH